MEATCSSTDEWLKKMGNIHTMEYYSAIKKESNFAICNNKDGPGGYMLSEISQKEKDRYSMLSLVCGI